MRSVEDILRRFRPTTAPGAATPTGVPVDRESERSSELEGVFASVEGSVAEAHELLEKARKRAEEIRKRTRDEVEDIVATARSRSDEERAAAGARANEALAREREELLAGARAEADRIDSRAEAGVDDVVAHMLDGLASLAEAVPVGDGADAGGQP